MKNKINLSKHLLWCIVLLLVPIASKLNGQTCSGPININANTCLSNFISSDTVVWFSFNTGTSGNNCAISLSCDTPAVDFSALRLYAGSCSTLTLIGSGYYDQTALIIESTLTANTTYLIKATRSNSSPTNTNLCLSLNSVVPCPPCTFANCQLVCNSDLELYSNTVISGLNQLHNNTCNWKKPNGSPDYFNVNANANSNVQVPINFSGVQTAHTGNGYAGIYCYYNNPGSTTSDTNFREYIQTQLPQPLIANQPYLISFWVSLSDYSGYAVNHIGAYFSSSQPVQNTPQDVINFAPQIQSTSIITNMNGWTQITGTFTPSQSGLQWVTIGNFETDQQQQQQLVVPTGNNTSAGGNPNWGAYYYIDDVTVQPAVPTTLTYAPNPLCPTTSQYTVTANTPYSNNGFTWQVPSGVNWSCNNAPCTSITVTPPFNTSATYIATTTIPAYGNCQSSAAIQPVWQNGPTSVSAGADITSCPGGTVTLNATANGNFNGFGWYTINGNQICNICTSTSVSPTVTTQYIFTATNLSTGCSLSDTVTVNIVPLNINIVSPPGATTCSGCFNFTTAANYSTYFWSTNAVNSSGGNTSTLNACWGAPYDTSGLTGNVSVSVVDANGCQGSAYIFVPSCCPFKEGQFSSYPNLINDSTSRVDNFTYPSLYNYNTANGYYEASNKQFSINGVYVIDRDTRFIGCEVKLGPNAKIIVRPGKKFEMTNFGTTVTKLYACTDMWDGIYVDGINSATKVTVLNGTVIEDAKNAIVSTNGGNFFLDGGTTFNKLNKNNIGILIKSYSGTHPGIIRKTIFSCDAPGQQGATSGVTSPGSNCRAPISGTSLAGIYIENCSNVTVGDSTVSAYRNLFERTKFGVYSFKSNVKVWNNDFKYFTTTSVGKNVPSNGIAVYASSAKFFPRTLTVGKPGNYKAKNKFTKCSYGTFAVTWVALLCEYNRYDSCSVQGITAMNTAGQVVTINADTLTECTGTNIQCTQVGGSNVTITRNLINQLSNFNLTNFGHTGILVSNSVLSYVNLKIQYNTVKKMKNGIWVSRVKNAKITDNSQINFMAGQPMSQSNPCIGIKLEEVNNSMIRMNGVAFPTSPTQAVHDEIFGVHMTNCVNDTVTKNTFARMGSAVFLKGTCNPSMLACNNMITCFYDFNFNYLNNYGAGVSVNDQITWGGPTAYFTTGNSFSPPNWTAGAKNLTGRIQQINGNGIKWYYPNSTPAPTAAMFLGSLYGFAPQDTSTGDKCSQMLAPPTQGPEVQRNFALSGICKTPRSYDTLNSAMQYHDKTYAYRALRDNPSWKTLGTADDAYYVNFYNTNSTGNIGRFADVEDSITSGKVTGAITILNTIVPSGEYELNRKLLLEVFLRSWAIDSMNISVSDSIILAGLINQGTVSGGTSVFDARNMLRREIHDSSNVRFINPELMPVVVPIVSPAFPNPTSGNISINIEVQEGSSGEFQLFDLSGRLVKSWQFTGGEGLYTFDASSITTGTYIYNVTVNRDMIMSERIVIIRE